MAFLLDSQLLVSASDNNTVKLWDSKMEALCSTLEGHLNWVRVVAFSPDGQLLVSVSLDNIVRLWDFKIGDTIQILYTKGFINKLSFSSNGSYLKTNHEILELSSLCHPLSQSQSNYLTHLYIKE